MKRHLNWLFVILLLVIGLSFTWHYAKYDYIFEAADTSNLCDSWQEYNIYKDVIKGEAAPILWRGWKARGGIITSALTTTRLPALIQKATGWNSESLFRYFAIPIVLWLPVALYFLAKKFVPSFGAFMIGLLFILQPNFRMAPGYARIVIAELFVVLSIYLLVSKIRLRISIPLLVILATAITVTHYSTAFITIPFLFMWAGISMIRKIPTLAMTSFLLILLVFNVLWHHFFIVSSGDYAQTTIAKSIPYLQEVAETTNGMIQRANAILSSFTVLTVWIKIQTVIIWIIEGLTIIGLWVNFKSQKLLAGAVISLLALISTGYWLPPIADGYGVGRIVFFASPVLLIYAAIVARKLLLNAGCLLKRS